MDKRAFQVALGEVGGSASSTPSPPDAPSGMGVFDFGMPEAGAGSFLSSHPVLYMTAVALGFHVPVTDAQAAAQPGLKWLKVLYPALVFLIIVASCGLGFLLRVSLSLEDQVRLMSGCGRTDGC